MSVPYDARGKVNRALIVGVPEYGKGPETTRRQAPEDIKAVRHNVSRLAAALRLGKVFKEREVIEAFPEDHNDFDDRLDQAVKEAKGLLLLYFAGHGAVPHDGSELFLQFPKARTLPGTDKVFRDAEEFSKVIAALTSSQAERIVVILDCCFAGNAEQLAAAADLDRDRFLLLMSVQAGRRIDAGSARTPTPFTAALTRHLTTAPPKADGGITFRGLLEPLRTDLRHHFVLPIGLQDRWVPRIWPAGDGDVLLAADRPPETPPNDNPHCVRRVVTAAAVLAALVPLFCGDIRIVPSSGTCAPTQELRVLTDPDLAAVLRTAARVYLTDKANQSDGCPRSLVTVYSARAGDAVAALRNHAAEWQNPPGNQTATPRNAEASGAPAAALDPQRDIGPQPDLWIPGTLADFKTVDTGQVSRDAELSLAKPATPLALSPMVLAASLSEGARAPAATGRQGKHLAELVSEFEMQGEDRQVRRADPESATGALLATSALYQSGDIAGAERLLAQPGRPAADGHDLLCDVADTEETDLRTAALVPEFLLRQGVDCKAQTRMSRYAAYPDDVPELAPVVVEVSWHQADGNAPNRLTARDDFVRWLRGEAGRKVFDGAGLWTGPRAPATVRDSGTLTPQTHPHAADPTALEKALATYRSATGPGSVLFLLDNSGSMANLWSGTGGAPALIEQSLAGLGGRDEYGVWAVSAPDGAKRPYSELLKFGRHDRAQASKALTEAKTTEHQADPYGALAAAVDQLAQRDKNDKHPRLIVLLTDDEDNGRAGSATSLSALRNKAAKEKVPIVMASFNGAACEGDRPDRQISDRSGGFCLDARDNLAASLRDEVARIGEGDSTAERSAG